MLIPLNQVVGIFRSRLGFRTPEGRGRHQINRVWRQKSSNLSQRDKHISSRCGKSYEDLEVWQRSRLLAVAVCRAMQDCRDFGLRDQITRSAV